MAEKCLEDTWTWSSLSRKVATGRERPWRDEKGRDGTRKVGAGSVSDPDPDSESGSGQKY